jgi:hypothetical protein
MSNKEPLYSVLVLFGRETARSVASPAVFQDIVSPVVDLLQATGCKLTCRGTIEGEKGKNVAPRKGPWSAALRDKWTAALGQDRFKAIELFDQAWGEGHHPDAFATIHKLWGYGPGGYTERTKEGPENNITVAIRADLVENAFERLEAAARPLVEKIDCFYGVIEFDVPWGRPWRSTIQDLIDVRWHARSANDYRNGKYRMENMIPRLNRANLLCRSQFTNFDFQKLPKLPGVAKVEEWSSDLTYLRLAEQPEYGAKPPPHFTEFIRFIPE